MIRSPLRLSPTRLGIVALTLLALVLGGATELWEQALLALLMAALALFAPPRRCLEAWPTFLFFALFLLALATFLPASWFPAAPWRERLVSDLGMTLPFTRTPQPWLTLQACCLLFIGLFWAYYLFGQKWDSEKRPKAAQLLVFGVAVLAALAVAAFAFGFHMPNWDQEENRGWFPNRNQTADVLAVCGVINYALIYDCLRKGKRMGYFWLATLVVIGAALIVSYSRAGILLFFGGIALWHVWPVRGQKRSGAWIKRTALSVALGLLLLTLFFLFGGETLERFQSRPAHASRESADFRLLIQKDALLFSFQTPGLGIGLGNFEPLFASARQASVNEDRAIHPESDWLWAACELGWLGPLIFIAGIVWWLKKCLPFQLKSGESLRRAITVAALLFIGHGFIDVGGHRIGSFMVGLFLISLAIPSAKAGPRWRSGPRLFRWPAFAVIFVGVWWLASALGIPLLPPTTASLARIESRMDEALAHAQVTEMENLANAGLRIAPLDWHLYFQRGYAEAFQPGKLARGATDFKLARGLESKWVKPCYDEGAIWLAADQPDLCVDAWAEGLRRATPGERDDFYNNMVALSTSNELVHARLLDLAAGNVAEQLIFLDHASADETKKIVAAVLAADPDLRTLDTGRRTTLFTAWWLQGDRNDLVARLQEHPEWLDAGWLFLAQSYAGQKDFQRAWETVARHAPAPLIPNISSDRSLEDLRTAFADDDSFATGMMLYLAQSRQGQTEDAIATLRVMENLKNCPSYVLYLEAQLWAARQQWELAWDAWWNYHNAQEKG